MKRVAPVRRKLYQYQTWTALLAVPSHMADGGPLGVQGRPAGLADDWGACSTQGHFR